MKIQIVWRATTKWMKWLVFQCHTRWWRGLHIWCGSHRPLPTPPALAWKQMLPNQLLRHTMMVVSNTKGWLRIKCDSLHISEATMHHFKVLWMHWHKGSNLMHEKPLVNSFEDKLRHFLHCNLLGCCMWLHDCSHMHLESNSIFSKLRSELRHTIRFWINTICILYTKIQMGHSRGVMLSDSAKLQTEI